VKAKLLALNLGLMMRDDYPSTIEAFAYRKGHRHAEFSNHFL
jgi:hypothetical protein